jgi:signal peptidase I
MVPVLKPKDKIFVTKLVYGPKLPFSKLRIPGFGKIKRGDVVVFVPPREVTRPWYKRRQFVKRLIGLPGERISIADGNIYINGEKIEDYRIDRNYYRSEFAYGQYATEGSEVLVPQGKYFFLGDNSSQSQDSREWGWADQEWIVGKALFLWWPPKRVGKLR